MELWIRSQDKQTLIKAEHLDIYNAGIEDEEPCYVIEECGVDLGSYETLKRAIEVLDEIQSILNPKYILDSSSIKPDGDSWVENSIVMQKYNANAKIEEISTYVYEMPKE